MARPSLADTGWDTAVASAACWDSTPIGAEAADNTAADSAAGAAVDTAGDRADDGQDCIAYRAAPALGTWALPAGCRSYRA